MFRVIDHSADVGVEIEADSIENLFIEGMKALTAITVKTAKAKEESNVKVEIEGMDIEDLFIRWLNEGIYLIYVKKLLPVRVLKIVIENLKVTSTIAVKRISPDTDKFKIELKAATYHGLNLERKDNKYRIQVVFDI